MKKLLCVLVILITLLVIPFYAETKEASTWAEESVDSLKEFNLFREETFSNYKDNITRKDFIYLAVRIFEAIKGEEITPNPDLAFKDSNDIYALKGATIGITSGIGNGNFGPDLLLTREQLAVLMVNTMKLSGLDLKPLTAYTFKDEDEFSPWAREAIYIAKANGIIDGVGDDKFDCSGNATNEVALIITNKILNNNGVEKKSEIARIIENETMSMSEILDKYNHSDEVVLEINRVSESYDWDKDGLLDYYEIYRNFTDPNNPDTDGDGIMDSDWQERREYTYTVEIELRLFEPYDLDFMAEHLYEDVLVIEETDQYADVKVLLYPFNKFNETVVANHAWQKDNLDIIGKLTPGIRNDWDDQMQEDLLKLLSDHKIDIDQMSDIDIVYAIINLFENSEYGYGSYDNFEKIISMNRADEPSFHMYDWYRAYDDENKQFVFHSAVTDVDEINNEVNLMVKNFTEHSGEEWTEESVWDIMTSSKAGFYEKLHGSCSGTSAFYANIFQALGIPTKVLPYQSVYDGYKVNPDVPNENLYGQNLIKQFEQFSNKKVGGELVNVANLGGSNHVTNIIFLGNRWVNIDIAGGQKFNYSLDDNGRMVFLKSASFDYNETQETITEAWLGGYDYGQKKLRESENFDSDLEKYPAAVNNFSQRTYNVTDLYGQHMRAEILAYINNYKVEEYRSNYSRFLDSFVSDEKILTHSHIKPYSEWKNAKLLIENRAVNKENLMKLFSQYDMENRVFVSFSEREGGDINRDFLGDDYKIIAYTGWAFDEAKKNYDYFNAAIINADYNYDLMPQEIKNNVSIEDYKNVSQDKPIILELKDKMLILIIK